MKKVLLSAAAIFAFGFANAQSTDAESTGFGFSQGNILLEGNLMFNSSKEEVEGFEVKESNFNFNPKAGYFVTDKLAVGLELMVGSGKEEETTPFGTEEFKTNNFGAGVFARYYFLELGERFKTYTEFGVGFGSQKGEFEGEEVFKDNYFRAGLDLGINYFITDSFAINFGLANIIGFNSTKNEEPGQPDFKTNEFNANINVFRNFFDTPTFGLTYKF